MECTTPEAMLPVFMLRLAVAGILGILIGLEREYRAKEAGVRTHFLVAMGSALLMIASQWGFFDVLSLKTAADLRLDPSRVAAQIVSGIGFIGAGTIMMHKEFVRGLTTAAGLWVASGIGIAVGGGLYAVGVTGTLLALTGMEVLPFFTRKFKVKCTSVSLIADSSYNISSLLDKMGGEGYRIISFQVEPLKKSPEKIRLHLMIREHDQGNENSLMIFLAQFTELTIEKVE